MMSDEGREKLRVARRDVAEGRKRWLLARRTLAAFDFQNPPPLSEVKSKLRESLVLRRNEKTAILDAAEENERWISAAMRAPLKNFGVTLASR